MALEHYEFPACAADIELARGKRDLASAARLLLLALNQVPHPPKRNRAEYAHFQEARTAIVARCDSLLRAGRAGGPEISSGKRVRGDSGGGALAERAAARQRASNRAEAATHTRSRHPA
jgi:hypothetical protein